MYVLSAEVEVYFKVLCWYFPVIWMKQLCKNIKSWFVRDYRPLGRPQDRQEWIPLYLNIRSNIKCTLQAQCMCEIISERIWNRWITAAIHSWHRSVETGYLHSKTARPGIELTAMGLDGRHSTPRGGERSFCYVFQNNSWAHPVSYPTDTAIFPRGCSDRSMKLTTHFHLELKLRMRGAISPLPHTPSWHGA
jgi:hypothetical protein